MPKTDTLAPPGAGIRNASPCIHGEHNKCTVWDWDASVDWAVAVTRDRRTHGDKAVDVEMSGLRLDLTDPTGQMHAVWWIAEQMGLPEPTTAVMRWRGGHEWDIVVDRPRGVYPGGQPDIDACERRVVPRMTSGMQRLSERRGMHRLFVVVPALADIAPDDRAGAIAAIAAIMWALVEVPCGR